MRVLKSLDQWALDSGLEYDSTTGSIRLAVGGGGWLADSLDGSQVPPAPWTKLGGLTTISIVDGRMKIVDASTSDYIRYQYSWSATGACAYTRETTGDASSTGNACAMTFAAGLKFWQLACAVDGMINITADTTYNIDAKKYAAKEIFIAAQNNVGKVYCWNPYTSVWDLIHTSAGATAGSNYLDFGSSSLVMTGTSFWDFVKLKASYQDTPYLTTSPKATMGVVDVYNTIEELPLTDNGNVWEYDKDGAGWVTPGSGTFAELGTALIGGYASTLNLRVAMPSDGLTPRNIGVNGRSMTGEFQPRNFVF